MGKRKKGYRGTKIMKNAFFDEEQQNGQKSLKSIFCFEACVVSAAQRFVVHQIFLFLFLSATAHREIERERERKL